MIEIRFDETQFTKALEGVRECVKLGLVDPDHGTLPKQAQLLVEHCMRLTPPKNANQGTERVGFDLNKIFHPINPNEIKSPDIRRLVIESDPVAWNAMASKLRTGPFAGTRAVVPTENLHRMARDGRGRGRRTNAVTLKAQLPDLNALKAAAMKRVGWAKAGWLKAYLGLKGKRVADWVARHGTARGQFENGLASSRPYIAVYNDTGWGRSGEAQRIVSNAFAARTKAMITYVNTAMRLAGEGKPTRWQAKMASEAARTEI